MNADIVAQRRQLTNEELASLPSKRRPPSVRDVVQLKANGPHDQKDAGSLIVRFAFDGATRDRFFSYEEHELARLPVFIDGFREAAIRGVRPGCVYDGWHRVGQKMIFVTSGRLHVTCVDLHGESASLALDPGDGLWIPRFILHSYQVLADAADLQIIANTVCENLHDTTDTRVYDVYSRDSFQELQKHYCNPPPPDGSAPAAAESPR